MMRFAVLIYLLGIVSLRGLEIELDYSLDTYGFFGETGSQERAALRAVADFYESILQDDLEPIDAEAFGGNVSWSARISHPGTGASYEIPNLVVPRDTLIVYAGGQPLASAGRGGAGGFRASGNQAWFDHIQARGETNPDGSPAHGEGALDFGPWGGQITFDTERTWNFSLTERREDGSWGSDFVPTALHELGHLLGLGSSSDSWQTHTDTSDPAAPVFRGPHAVASFGGPVPMQPSTYPSHWQDDGACVYPLGHDPDNGRNVLSLTLEQFGVPAGVEQIARMDPSSCATGTRLRVFTELDVAALQDVGWDIEMGSAPTRDLPVLNLDVLPDGARRLQWDAVPGARYQVESSRDLSQWTPLGTWLEANEATLHADDTSPGGIRLFYRLRQE